MMANTLFLKNELAQHSIDINLVHPGVCATELFTKSHSKFFVKIIYPLMKLIFHNTKKAALNIIKAIFVETKDNEWIVPRGLFEVWGYPKIKKMKKGLYNKEDVSRCNEIIEDMIIRHNL
jgi:hypothetical protein